MYQEALYFGYIQESLRVYAAGNNNVARIHNNIFFQSNKNLKNTPVYGIKVITQNEATGMNSNGNVLPTLSLDVHSKYTITLAKYDPTKSEHDEPDYILYNYSLAQLSDSTRRGRMLEFDGILIDLGKSYITPQVNMVAFPGTFFIQFFTDKL